ncbi:uncharacterized protein LOC105433807 [Pogonomyrmex barbatus]|uniref:Uncharacterized protein LOC105433807 n=1 Tax=Pogonomyrmex barbatus TaxID=144034 RepID=A0A6I9XNB0_9HYME|nr:uncharacterized protein LOC105433807 [Pogonomyrmex barbatus]XP_011647560.1 uncharacterized protein LOC105433807 [Pogonomyrmex barbatus]XP_011647561.1 uncharacterized protein LOC105433807 [Pogonomyrmex barbatus]XP_011647562.1 uncharacterized protein LOC105433807 [Pogonomyrmex barbatus]
MALTLKKPCALTILVKTCIVMLIFYFAGCATGSCTNYGHSCWGAHGKRNIQGASTILDSAAETPLNGSPQNSIAPTSKMQWILSRLIESHGQPTLTDKYRDRWNGFPKDKSYIPPKWDHDTASMTDESIESIRIPINNERKINNAQGPMCNMNKRFENNPEILLISPDEYNKPINDPQKLNILNFLNEGNEGTK